MPLPVAAQDARLGPPQGRGVDDRTGQTAIDLRIGFGSAQLLQQDQAVRPGQVEDAVGQTEVAVFLGQGIDSGTRLGNSGDDIDPHGFIRLQKNGLADADDRIEDGALAVGKGLVAVQGRGGCERPLAADEPQTIGFVGRLADRGAPHRHHMRHPRGAFFGRTRTARGVDRLTAVDQLGLHEQIAERRMGFVLRLRRQHDLGIAGDLDGPRRLRTVGQRHTPQFDVVLGRDADLGVGLELAVAAAELGPGLCEDRFIALGGPGRWLPGARPHRAGFHIADVAEAAIAVARRILAPTRDRQIAPAAVPAAGAGHDHVVAAVGQQMGVHRRAAGIGEHAHRARLFGRSGSRGPRFAGVRKDRRAGLGNAFLQQQIGRPQHGIGQEAALHGLVEQHVGQRQQTHAFVMRHELPQGDTIRAGRTPRRREVDRFVESASALLAIGRQSFQVAASRLGCHHQR